MQKDPIPRFAASLKEMDVADDEQLANIRQQLEQEVEAAVQFAEESPWPDPSEVMDDVYTTPIVV